MAAKPYDGLVGGRGRQHVIQRHRVGVADHGGAASLLLTPAKRADAKQLGMTLEPDQYFTAPPGRGYLATTGAPTLIQAITGY
jgi:hypothetical protein